jgi:FAD/FMN-containing dehydrogenase
MVTKELPDILGRQNVQEDETVLEGYSHDISFAPKIRPRMVVRPTSAAEVQTLIRWANETSTPLVPVSSGPPHFRGDTVPSTGGAVIVDLSGMKKIIRLDPRNWVVMIEPGVTFAELIPQVEQAGIKLNLPLLPRPNKSVIGSMLEREPVIMPVYQWDALDPLTCIEVIFGTGDLFRTGSAAGPGTIEEQWKAKQAQVNPMGPGQTDFARVVQGSQGTMGIVTWSTVRCELKPSLQKPFMVGGNSLDKLISLAYRLLWLKSVNECFIVNNVNLASIMAKTSTEFSNLKNALPRWIFFFVHSGFEYYPEERIAYQEKNMIEASQKIGVSPINALGGVSASELLRIVGKPADLPYWKLRQQGACQDIYCLSTLDKTERLIEVMRQQADWSGYSTSDLGIYIQPMVQGSSCHLEFNLFYNPADKREASKVQSLYSTAAEALMNAAGFLNRPYGAIAKLAYQRDAETTAALRKVKSIFDPHNIMNAGKLCF